MTKIHNFLGPLFEICKSILKDLGVPRWESTQVVLHHLVTRPPTILHLVAAAGYIFIVCDQALTIVQLPSLLGDLEPLPAFPIMTLWLPVVFLIYIHHWNSQKWGESIVVGCHSFIVCDKVLTIAHCSSLPETSSFRKMNLGFFQTCFFI